MSFSGWTPRLTNSLTVGLFLKEEKWRWMAKGRGGGGGRTTHTCMLKNNVIPLNSVSSVNVVTFSKWPYIQRTTGTETRRRRRRRPPHVWKMAKFVRVILHGNRQKGLAIYISRGETRREQRERKQKSPAPSTLHSSKRNLL